MRNLSIFLGVFFWLSICITPARAIDTLECPKGHLAFDMIRKTFVPQDKYSAHIYGILDVPTPHTYELTFKDDKKSKHYLHGTLKLKPAVHDNEDEEMVSLEAEELPTLKIQESFKVLPKTEGVFIDVVKQFTFGNEYVEYYKVKFADVDVENESKEEGRIMLCLKPELYK